MSDNTLLMRPVHIQQLLGISASKFHQLKKTDNFPKARKLPNSNTPYYLRQEIEKWAIS